MRIAFIVTVLLCINNPIYMADNQYSKTDYTHADGEKYIGSFKNGLKNGHGTWVHPSGDKYVGKFKDGVKRG